MSWEERHSITCAQCGNLADEREAIPADLYNGNDGGEICKNCQEINSSKSKSVSVILACRIVVELPPGVNDIEEKIHEVTNNLDYHFTYQDDEAKIIDTEIEGEEIRRIHLH